MFGLPGGMRAVLAALALTFGGAAGEGVMAQLERETVEQPAYEVVATVGDIEIRQYGPRLAAETDMGAGPGIEAEQDSAFMRLAAFIFAQNREGPDVAMTAPVAIAPEPIAMTAPVAMEPATGGQVMRLFMPAEYTLETLPRPGDERVRIVTVPAQILAVLRFSGEATDEVVAAMKQDLLAGLRGSDWSPIAAPGFFGYDPPMTPPEQRRNEVFVEIAPPDAAGASAQAAGGE